MIFVDTGGWFASVVVSDRNHRAAVTWLSQNTEPLITTDYVVDESLTLLKARGEAAHAIRLGELFFAGAMATVYRLTEDDILATWDTFRRYADKDWSFTDCSSKVVIERLGITRAFVFDQHFRQFGSVVVVP